MKAVCDLCFRHCILNEGQLGYCRARGNIKGKITCLNYGKVTSLCLDPIEKKPLRLYMPGSNILSVGSYGCNLSCPFCQNHEISMAGEDEVKYTFMQPEELAVKALELMPRGNIGVAYTYNEPLVGYEYVLDSSQLVKELGMKNILVTNASVNEEKWLGLMPFIDAVNIDLKGFTKSWYSKLGGDLDTVKRNIENSFAHCHVEITTLIIPGENDDENEMREMAGWISSFDENTAFHISRFYPRHKMESSTATDVSKTYRLADIARKYLKNVYTGNC